MTHRHFGQLVTRDATPTEIKTGQAWGVKNPARITENICVRCDARI